jgi:hypothetical protein
MSIGLDNSLSLLRELIPCSNGYWYATAEELGLNQSVLIFEPAVEDGE